MGDNPYICPNCGVGVVYRSNDCADHRAPPVGPIATALETDPVEDDPKATESIRKILSALCDQGGETVEKSDSANVECVFEGPRLGVSAEDVFRAIEAVLGVSKKQLQNKKRHRNVAHPRRFFSCIMRVYGRNAAGDKISLQAIGALLDRHYTTIIFQLEDCKRLLIEGDTDFLTTLQKILAQLEL